MFFSLNQLTENWIKKKGLIQFLKEKEVVNLANNYFQQIKNYSPNEIKAVAFKHQELFIVCSRSGLANEVRLESEALEDYLKKRIPSLKIKKLNFRIIA